MGYGFGAFLLAVGLILALAVTDHINGVDLTIVGWILAAVGVVCIALTAISWNRGRSSRSYSAVTHRDGTQTTEERRTSDL